MLSRENVFRILTDRKSVRKLLANVEKCSTSLLTKKTEN